MAPFHVAVPPATREPSEIAIRTRYMIMLEECDRRIPFSHACMVAVSQWVLLAGYLVVPGTFTSLQKSHAFEDASPQLVRVIQNPPLLAVSCICLISGAATLSWLAWRWRFNYVWLSKLFRPTIFNALAGFLTTLINIYSAQDGDWSIMAILTVVVTATVMVASTTFTVYFYYVKLSVIKLEHQREMRHAALLQWRRDLDLQP